MRFVNSVNQIDVLIIESQEAHVLLAKTCLEALSTKTNIHILYDGEEAINYLDDLKRNDCDKLPDIIMLEKDLNKKNGFEVLDFIKQDEVLRLIPTIFLCNEVKEMDVRKGYELQANAYILKPDNELEYSYLAKVIERFWFKSAKKINSRSIKEVLYDISSRD